MTRRKLRNIFAKHQGCSWFEKFEFTDCRIEIEDELLKILNKKGKVIKK